MNRNEEFLLLKQQLAETPAELEMSYTRALEKYQGRKKRKRWIEFSASGLLSICVLFVILVNVFPSFAYACGKIPVLKELAQVVAFSPSLQAAIENAYVQPIGISQTKKGITVTIEYVIVDQKRVEIFYTLNAQVYENLSPTFPRIKAENGGELDGYILENGDQQEENGVIRRMSIDFLENNVPDTLQLALGVYEREAHVYAGKKDGEEASSIENPLEEFNFTLQFDPAFTSQGKRLTVQESFEIDGQSLEIIDVEIYPTHMRLNLKDAPENTAWLKELSFYFENEKGKRFEKISNGTTATGTVDSPMMSGHRLESSFFYESKELTLYITGAKWLEKNKTQVQVDLLKEEIAFLPPNVELKGFVNTRKNNWEIRFLVKEERENATFQIWNWDYTDEEGKEYMISGRSSGTYNYFDEQKQKYIDKTGKFEETIYLNNCPSHVIYLSPEFSKVTKLAEPLSFSIKS